MSQRALKSYRLVLIAVCILVVVAGCTRQKAVELTPAVTATAVSPESLATPTAEVVAPTETPVAAPLTPAPTAVVPQGLKLSAQVIKEESATDRFKLEISVPRLEGATDTVSAGLDAAVEKYVSETVTSFKTMAIESASNELIPTELVSYLIGGYEVEGVVNGVLSLRLTVEQYAAGAAHPSHANYALNYELANARVLPLASLFESDADYLKVLSDYCVSELKKTESFVFEDGAEPKSENYAVWNLKPDGLLITFEEYQVAPYAAGPQTVLVPYAELRGILDPTGPLAPFAE